MPGSVMSEGLPTRLLRLIDVASRRKVPPLPSRRRGEKASGMMPEQVVRQKVECHILVRFIRGWR